ncbi:MAG: hypothetical protein JW804_04295 [Sedimentisphaerales bacterium]|nr:hypothetical protein [Sedimentisphaerales bacterium]
MGMKEDITNRFEALINQGQKLIGTLGPAVSIIRQDGTTEYDNNKYEYWVPEKKIPEFRAWLSSATSLIHFITPDGTHYAQECDKVMASEDLERGIPSKVLVLMLGLLMGAKNDWQCGFLGKMEYIISGATFDDFLDHAEKYHKGGKRIESSVLASAVLEDTIKKICKKNSINSSGKGLDDIINQLAQAGILTQVKAKRVRSFAGVRNNALHAEWDKFDISDVGAMIKGIRELIEELL